MFLWGERQCFIFITISQLNTDIIIFLKVKCVSACYTFVPYSSYNPDFTKKSQKLFFLKLHCMVYA